MMPEFAIYLLKANLSILLFYIGYALLLRKLTFYQLNRFYFLFGLAFSMLYPAIDLSFFFKKNQEFTAPVRAWVPDWQQLAQTPTKHDMIWNTVLCFFICTVLLFTIRFFIRLFGLYRIHKASVPAIYTIYHYRKLFLQVPPFSFWKSIYINPTPYDQAELENILKHESQHVNSLHTFDMLLTELVSLFCWFNPAIWLTKHAIRENLEFITDQHVLNSGADRKQYQYSLVKVLTNHQQNTLANHFNLRNLKRRILMMNKNKSSLFNLGKYVFTVPVIVLISLIFTLSNAYEGGQIDALLQTATDTIQVKPAIPFALSADTNKRPDKPENIKASGRLSEKKRKSIHNPNPIHHPLYVVDGRTVTQPIDSLRPDDIESISVYKGAKAVLAYGTKGKDGVIDILTHKHKAEKKDASEPITVIGYGTTTPPQDTAKTGNPTKSTHITIRENKDKEKTDLPIYFVNETTVAASELRDINPKDIQSINVIKDGTSSGKPEIHITLENVASPQ